MKLKDKKKSFNHYQAGEKKGGGRRRKAEGKAKIDIFCLTVSDVPLKGQELVIIAGSYRPFHQICKDIKTIHSPHSEICFKRGYPTRGKERMKRENVYVTSDLCPNILNFPER